MNLMRQIENDVKPRWDQIKSGQKLEGYHEDCPPSLLKGWTDDNPSLWEIDNPEKPDREKILIALCRRQRDWDKITYILFNRSAIDNSDLKLTQSNGNTGDNKIDNSKTHYEIKNLHAKSLCRLIYNIMISEFEIGNYKKREFEQALLVAYDNSQVTTRTDAMSIQPREIGAITETENKGIVKQEEKTQIIDKSNTTESIDPSTGESNSTTL